MLSLKSRSLIILMISCLCFDAKAKKLIAKDDLKSRKHESRSYESHKHETINKDKMLNGIGVVDMDYIVSNMLEVKKMNQEIDLILKEIEKKLSVVQVNLQENYKNSVNRDHRLSKEKMKDEIEKYNQKISQYQLNFKKIKNELEKIKTYNLDVIYANVDKIIEQIALEENYLLILHKPQVAYFSKKLNISPKVLNILDQRKVKLKSIDLLQFKELME